MVVSCSIKAAEVLERLSKHILVDGFPIVVDLKGSEGVWLKDAATGKLFLDCYSYFASLPLGHNHPAVLEEGFKERLLEAALANPANSDVYTTLLAESVDVFARIASPRGFKHLFFVAGGAVAVENALKCAFDWKSKKNATVGKPPADKVVYFDEAFHGRTGYALSCTHISGAKIDLFPRLQWLMLPNPKLTFPVTEEVEADVAAKEAEVLATLENALKEEGWRYAAIIIEPIQGEGGDNHFRGEFLAGLRSLADRYDVMLVFDEVQTGCGTTGKFWCWQHFGVAPDIIVFGKKSQVCGIIATERVDEVEENVFTISGRINSTWGGNLVDFVRGARYLEVISEEGLVANASDVGTYFLASLQDWAEKQNGLITNVRGRGLMLAFDTPSADFRAKLWKAAFDAGLLCLPLRDKSIRFRPPLIFSNDNVDTVIETLDEAIKKVK